MRTGTVVQGLWIGPRLSTMEYLSNRSFMQNGHPYRLYVYDPVQNVPTGATLMPADAILPREKIFRYRDYDSYAGFANLFAYKVLLEQGGYWADCDMICLRPLDLASPYVFPAERAQDGSLRVNNCIMKTPAHSDMMAWAYEIAARQDVSTLEWNQTGPLLITQLIAALRLQEHVVPPRVFCPIDHWRWRDAISGRLPRQLLVRLMLARGARGVHLWNEMWRRHDTDKDGTYHPRSLYETLKRRYLTEGSSSR